MEGILVSLVVVVMLYWTGLRIRSLIRPEVRLRDLITSRLIASPNTSASSPGPSFTRLLTTTGQMRSEHKE